MRRSIFAGDCRTNPYDFDDDWEVRCPTCEGEGGIDADGYPNRNGTRCARCDGNERIRIAELTDAEWRRECKR